MLNYTPINKSLYSKIKKQAKQKFTVWPSAYASSWLVKEYKRKGGKYKTSSPKKSPKRSPKRSPKKSPKKSPKRSPKRSPKKSTKISPKRSPKRSTKKSSKKLGGLNRWYSEQWINVCKLPDIVKCGRSKSYKNKNYPYCRPLKRINKYTPKTVKEIGLKEIKRRCQIKKKIKNNNISKYLKK